MSYVFAIPMKETSAENVVQAYLSGISAHKGGSISILSDNGREFKNTVLDHTCKQLAILRLFLNLFYPLGNLKIENVNNFFKRTLSKFLESSDLEWDELLSFVCYCYNIFPSSNETEPPFSSYMAMNKQKAYQPTSTTAANLTEKIRVIYFHVKKHNC